MTESPPFVIFALPRSRTFWLSKFLSYGEWVCAHDQANHARSIEDVRAWLSLPWTGSAETAAASFWRLALDIRPDLKIVTVRRSVGEVIGSLLRTGISFDRAAVETHIRRLDRRLDQIERFAPGVVSVDYYDLTKEETCRKIFEHCLDLPHDRGRWAAFHRTNLQVNLAAELRYLRGYASQLRQVEASCVRRIKTILRPARMGEPDVTGITIQEEPFSEAWKGAEPIMAEHCLAVGEDPEAWRDFNVPLMQKLEEMGAISVMTARCNGRMIGYLATILSQAVNKKNTIHAVQMGLFVCRDGANHDVGLKLTKAAVERAKQKGASEILMRSGIRGDGPRLDVLFRRLGAKENGRLFTIEREAA
jgi:hypothetical protein